MKKYRCPICKTIYTTKVSKCPGCGQEIHYLDELNMQSIKPKTEESPSKTENEETHKELPAVQEPEAAKEQTVNIKASQNDDLDYTEDISKYDGNSFAKIFMILGLTIVSIMTLGFFAPWAFCIVYNWENKHTVIDGFRLTFDGKGSQLFGRWMLWFFLSILTAGILALWIPHFLRKWKTKHTHLNTNKN